MTQREISNQESGNCNSLTSSDKLLPAQKDRHNYTRDKMLCKLHSELTHYVIGKLEIADDQFGKWVAEYVKIENEIAEILNKYF